MGRGDYEKLTPETIDALWVRLCASQAAKPTARPVGLSPDTVRAYLQRCGGIRRTAAAHALTWLETR